MRTPAVPRSAALHSMSIREPRPRAAILEVQLGCKLRASRGPRATFADWHEPRPQGANAMTSKNKGISGSIRAFLTAEPASVHFHLDADGRAFVCDSGRSEEHTSELQSLRHLV